MNSTSLGREDLRLKLEVPEPIDAGTYESIHIDPI